MGGRKLSTFPVTMSLIASLVSGRTIIGTSTEMYFYGSKFVFWILTIIPVCVSAAYIFLPVFHEMKLMSTYEYLERRFDKKGRLFGSIAFTVFLIGFLPVVLYVPALFLNQVTGLNLHLISIFVCSVCVFYTTIGGIRAVILTDVIQTIVIFTAVIVIIVKGTIKIGGLDVLWQRSLQGGRIEFPSFQFDFSETYTAWSVLLGGGWTWYQFSFMSQSMVQRYMALPTLKKVKRAVWGYLFGTVIMYIFAFLMGSLIYATYYNCDPLTTEVIKAKDQILPLFVMDALRDYQGIPGIFFAGIFSASLSTLSTGFNSMSAVVLQDFIKAPFPNWNLSERAALIIMKSVVVLLGALCIALVFLIEKLSAILRMSLSIESITSGPSLGIFFGGMLIPWMNTNGAFYGALIGLGANAFVIFGAQEAIGSGKMVFPTKLLSVDGCEYIHNATHAILTNVTSTESYVFPLFKMSFLWYAPFGMMITLLSGVLISYFTGFNDPSNIDPMVLSPVIRKYLPKRKVVESQELLSPQ